MSRSASFWLSAQAKGLARRGFGPGTAIADSWRMRPLRSLLGICCCLRWRAARSTKRQVKTRAAAVRAGPRARAVQAAPRAKAVRAARRPRAPASFWVRCTRRGPVFPTVPRARDAPPATASKDRWRARPWTAAAGSAPSTLRRALRLVRLAMRSPTSTARRCPRWASTHIRGPRRARPRPQRLACPRCLPVSAWRWTSPTFARISKTPTFAWRSWPRRRRSLAPTADWSTGRSSRSSVRPAAASSWAPIASRRLPRAVPSRPASPSWSPICAS